MTRSDVHDSVSVAAMLGRINRRLGRVDGDGAYAGGPTRRAVAGIAKRCPTPRACSGRGRRT